MNIEKNINKFKKLLPLIQAYIDGKEVELLSGEKWVHTDLNNICIDADRFRIKPEPKYRPFKDAEECWVEMQKHQPYGWVKSTLFKDLDLVQRVTTLYVEINRDIIDYKDTLEKFTFADGNPFGIKVEE